MDLPLDRTVPFGRNPSFDETAYHLEERILNTFDILCVFNNRMKDKIITRYGIGEDKFVEFELLDYGIDFTPPSSKHIDPKHWRLIYVGNMDEDYMGNWMTATPPNKNVSYKFVGKNGSWILRLHRLDISWIGLELSHQDLVEFMSRDSDFGIVTVGESRKHYYEYTASSKLSAYVSAGLPVIVEASQQFLSSLVMKYEIGIVVERIEEIPQALGRVSPKDYEYIRDHCLSLGSRLRKGEFFEHAIRNVMDRLVQHKYHIRTLVPSRAFRYL